MRPILPVRRCTTFSSESVEMMRLDCHTYLKDYCWHCTRLACKDLKVKRKKHEGKPAIRAFSV